MKKILFVMFILFVSLLGGCEKEVEIPVAMPTDVLSAEDIPTSVETSAQYVLKNGAIVDLGDGTYKAVYVTDPIGSDDSVTVELTIPQEGVSVNDIYREKYDARLEKKKIQGLGESAFVAFPMIHIVSNGYLIDISAGSGDTEQQFNTLVTLGEVACENLNAFLNPETEE